MPDKEPEDRTAGQDFIDKGTAGEHASLKGTAGEHVSLKGAASQDFIDIKSAAPRSSSVADLIPAATQKFREEEEARIQAIRQEATRPIADLVHQKLREEEEAQVRALRKDLEGVRPQELTRLLSIPPDRTSELLNEIIQRLTNIEQRLANIEAVLNQPPPEG